MFCLNCFHKFQIDKNVKQHQKYNHIELEIPKTFKRILNKKTDEMVEHMEIY